MPLKHHTPLGYLNEAALYHRNDPRYANAIARARMATAAARAAELGDLHGARGALRDLRRLEGLGAVDATAISRRIGERLARRANSLPAASRAAARGERIGTMVTTIAQLAGGVIGIIAAATGDAGVRKAADWANLILTGNVGTSFTESELRDMRAACAVWNGGVKAFVETFKLGAIAAANAARDRNAAQIVEDVFGWLVFALDTICSELAAEPTLDPNNIVNMPIGPGELLDPANPTRTCWPGTSPRDGRCQYPPGAPLTAIAAAKRRWNLALSRRVATELALYNCDAAEGAGRPAPPLLFFGYANCANARAADQATSDELFAAETEYLRLLGTGARLPRNGAVAESSVPRRYFFRRPGCSAARGGTPCGDFIRWRSLDTGGGSPGEGGDSGGAGGSKAALLVPAAALVAWYFLKPV